MFPINDMFPIVDIHWLWLDKRVWVIADISIESKWVWHYLTKDFQWLCLNDAHSYDDFSHDSKEKAEQHFKNWLNTLPKAKANRIFARYIANRLCSNG